MGDDTAFGNWGVASVLFAWTGRFRDIDTGLQWNDHRCNLYRYVGNGPTNYVDPSGLFPTTTADKLDYRVGVQCRANTLLRTNPHRSIATVGHTCSSGKSEAD